MSVILVIVAACLLAEALCRVFLPEYRRDLMVINNEGHRMHRSLYASRIYSHVNDSGYSWVQTDTKGRRISKGTIPNEGIDSFKIAFMGDSLTFGLHLDNEDSYPEILKKWLQERHPNRQIEIINCSVVAANLAELYAIYKSVCADSDIDLFIVQGTLNNEFGTYSLLGGENFGADIQMLAYQYQCYPKYIDGKFVFKGKERRIELLGQRGKLVEIYKNAFGSKLPLYSISHLIRKIEHNYITRFRFRCRSQRFPFLFNKSAKEVFIEALKAHGLKLGEVPSANFTVNLLKQWQTEIAESGAKFAVFSLPNKKGIKIFNGEAEEYRLLYDSFVKGLALNNLNHFEINNFLSADQSDQFFFKNDVHYNKLGYRKIAEELVDKIEPFLKQANR